MKLFQRKKNIKKKSERKSYDPAKQIPVLHCSICSGEQVAGFKDKGTGRFEEICLIRNEKDLEAFRAEYGITGPIEKEY